MSEDAKNAMDLGDAIATHGGWVAAAVASMTVWVAKVGAGRTLKTLDRVDERLGEIDARLSRIEGRFDEMDHK